MNPLTSPLMRQLLSNNNARKPQGDAAGTAVSPKTGHAMSADGQEAVAWTLVIILLIGVLVYSWVRRIEKGM